MITTYLSNASELTSVRDTELNELFQEIRKNDSKYYLQEVTMFERKHFWSRTKKKIWYTLYVDCKNSEYQAINFSQDHGGTFNTAVPKSYIMTYFYGLINGNTKWWK